MKYAMLSESSDDQVIKSVIAGKDWRAVMDAIIAVVYERYGEATGEELNPAPEDLDYFEVETEEEYFADHKPYEWVGELHYSDYEYYAKYEKSDVPVDAKAVDTFRFYVDELDFFVECVGEDLQSFVETFNAIDKFPWILDGYHIVPEIKESKTLVQELNDDLQMICFGNTTSLTWFSDEEEEDWDEEEEEE